MNPTFHRGGLLMAIAVALSVVALAQDKPKTPEALLHPEGLTETAPDMYKVVVDATSGMFVIQVHRAWAPVGADRFYNLVKHGFYNECRFFRVVKKFVAQFGINGDPAVSAVWSKANLAPDRARLSNTRGRVTFAQGTPDTRTTQVFINLSDNSRLDIDGFAPFGEVVTSMLMLDRIYAEYGEGPDQSMIQAEGNAFLMRYLPKMDYIKKATIEP
jgi:peptidyl-prolyl cis-trans isomerase A (cyclophilin A)